MLYSSSALAASHCESSSTNMAEVADCLAQDAQRRVDAAYSRLHAALNRKRPEAASLLEASQLSWSKFADDSCRFYVELKREEQGTTVANINCWADFADARVKVLDSWHKQLAK